MSKSSLLSSVRDKFSRRPSSCSTSSSLSTTKSASMNPSPISPWAARLQNVAGPSDAPPAYSPMAPTVANTLSNIPSDEDRYAFLSSFDTIFIVDDSRSMMGNSWREVEAALRAITPICTAHDPDGIDLYFLNHLSSSRATNGRAAGGYYNIINDKTVESIFKSVQPRCTTPTGARLHSILKPYIASLSSSSNIDNIRPVNIIVITDGRATDDPESVIVQHAKKLDQIEAPGHQVGIQFFQVGDDRGAREALRELDDDLSDQGIRDMVDAVTWDIDGNGRTKALTADGILKVVLGAVVRRLDRKTTTGDRQRRRR